MTIADWMICALVLVNVVAAAMQGFFAEALSLAGLVVGYMVAAWQYRGLAEWLESFLKNAWLAEILGFFIIFFAILLLFGIAARIARWMMKEAGLSGFDRFLGAVLGLLKGGLMVAVILMGMTAIRANIEAPAEFAIGALLSGRGTSRHLAGTGRNCVPVFIRVSICSIRLRRN